MIKRELAIFLIVGVSTVLVDFISYRGLIGFQVMEVDMAKAAGFLVGTLFAYFANRFWTFGHNPHVPGSVWRFSALYASTLGANVLTNALVLKLLADMAIGIETARLAWMRAAWEFDQGRRNTYYASIAKAWAGDVANKCATDAVQVRNF